MIRTVIKKVGRHEIDILQVARAKTRTGFLHWIAFNIFRNRNQHTVFLRDGTRLGLTFEEKKQLDICLQNHKKTLAVIEGIKIQRFAYKHGGSS